MPVRTPIVAASTADRTPIDARSTKGRSAVTNGTKLHADGDEKSPWTRRFRDLIQLHVDDLGGLEHLSEAQLSLVRRVATIEVELEQMEADLSKREPVSLDLYQRVTNTLGRQLDRLGLKRETPTKTVNPFVAHFSKPPERKA